jgi:hypothetical protein
MIPYTHYPPLATHTLTSRASMHTHTSEALCFSGALRVHDALITINAHTIRTHTTQTIHATHTLTLSWAMRSFLGCLTHIFHGSM